MMNQFHYLVVKKIISDQIKLCFSNYFELLRQKLARTKQYLIVLARCSNLFAVDGSNCADEYTINTYLSKYHEFLFLNIRLSQLNYITKELKYFYKLQYTSFDVKLYKFYYNNRKPSLLISVQLRVTTQAIDKYFSQKIINNYVKIYLQF
ncbi:unnamed protein product (macronuclear) [Paramecium tetraurelia]|uniref:Uncharacterized protein n=1 Tax=Paramecium tetraurelia TaxID=5888 RepID=A0DDX6_PARTE|nr:uncharacterized protein GSPATT00016084001 [Paramecium tetraurelia]CAK81243.1 unnamed protein product [Paramecium tetraurelia]|eukprot:XP_001448640.1 hypothetical protein (macronuclear) [Paramecium tetraurelia strain d4-2]